MAAPIPLARKQRGRPKVGATTVGVRLLPSQLAMLDDFIAAQPDDPKPGRPEGMWRILLSFLAGPAADVPAPPAVLSPVSAMATRGLDVQLGRSRTAPGSRLKKVKL